MKNQKSGKQVIDAVYRFSNTREGQFLKLNPTIKICRQIPELLSQDQRNFSFIFGNTFSKAYENLCVFCYLQKKKPFI